MFICMSTAPELLSQPSLEKQVFAVDLISHLSVVCAMPNSLSTARLAVNAIWTLLGVLAAKEREQLIIPILPALARMCRAFPPLIEDCIQVHLGSYYYLLLHTVKTCLAIVSSCYYVDIIRKC